MGVKSTNSGESYYDYFSASSHDAGNAPVGPPAPFNIEYLIIGGGGGGGTNNGGGGGAGGYRCNFTGGSSPTGTGGLPGAVEPTYEVFTNTEYTVYVGAGGRGGDKDQPNATSPDPHWAGRDGEDSKFFNIIAWGGGYGGGDGGNPAPQYPVAAGGDGGSGGGARYGGYNNPPGSGYPGGTKTPNPSSPLDPNASGQQGFPGGATGNTAYGGGGGGGAGAAGDDVPGGVNGGAGGAGRYSTITGSDVQRAGGGGGGSDNGSGGSGGAGGGGQGSPYAPTNGGDGTTNTGSGGGGGGGAAGGSTAGTGGPGLVVLRMPTDYEGTFSGATVTTITSVPGKNIYSVTAAPPTSTVTFTEAQNGIKIT